MYKLTQSNSIIRLSDNASIPADEANTDYRQYLEWVKEGNQASEADPIPQPDPKVLRAQAYISESDPIFFKEQRGEVAKGTWKKLVEEIRARYPVDGE